MALSQSPLRVRQLRLWGGVAPLQIPPSLLEACLDLRKISECLAEQDSMRLLLPRFLCRQTILQIFPASAVAKNTLICRGLAFEILFQSFVGCHRNFAEALDELYRECLLYLRLREPALRVSLTAMISCRKGIFYIGYLA